MKILIPPSEGKAKIKTAGTKFKNTNFKFEEHVSYVVTLLQLISDEDLTGVYGTSAEKALMYHRQNQDIFNSTCAPAIQRYTGVVYDHIKWDSLAQKEQDFLDKYVYIISGLFGILSPRTLIPDYKLKMNVLSLQSHWNPVITEELKNEDVIFDLLPQVHRKAYKPGKNVIQIDFSVLNKNGKKSAAGHFGKAVKGELIRFIAKNQVKKLDDFYDFKYDGFSWDGKSFVKNLDS